MSGLISAECAADDRNDAFIGVDQACRGDSAGLKAPSHRQRPRLRSIGLRHHASHGPANQDRCEVDHTAPGHHETRLHSQVVGAHAGY